MAFHWLLALLIIASFVFGLYMVELPFSPARLKQYNWHKWAGITILTLSTLRLLWRLSHRPPPLKLGRRAGGARARSAERLYTPAVARHFPLQHSDASRIHNEDVGHLPMYHLMIPWAMGAKITAPHRADNQLEIRYVKID